MSRTHFCFVQGGRLNIYAHLVLNEGSLFLLPMERSCREINLWFAVLGMGQLLTEHERLRLLKEHHKEKNRRNGDRIKAVLLGDDGYSYKAIAAVLFLDEETISRHIRDYISKKKLSLNSGGSQSKLNEPQARELVEHLSENSYLICTEICAYVHSKYGVVYTVSGMTDWLHSHGFSYKKPKPQPSKADPEKQSEFVKDYHKLLAETPDSEPILFADGVHPSMATKISYGWIRTGKKGKAIATTASRTRVNLMGAIELKSMKLITTVHDTINSDSMDEFFKQIQQCYSSSPKIHIILDNGPYNVSKKTKESARNYNICLHFLPTYSPNLNPIERVWKVMNEKVRNNVFFNSAKEFRKKITDFFDYTWEDIAPQLTSRINDNFETILSAV
jgi:transposase